MRRSSISCSTSLRSSPRPDHDAGLGEDRRIELLDPLQQPDRVEIAGAGPHRQIVRRHRLEIVVEHVGLAPRPRSPARRPCAGSRASGSRSWSPACAARMARMTSAKCCGAAIGEVVAVDRGDDDVGQAHLGLTASPTLSGSSRSSAVGMPVATLQNAQARVQISPMIMKVACFFSQHSPILGQPASSQTVTRLVRLHDLAGLGVAVETGALTRIQSGLRSTSWSGRCAFSGWRGARPWRSCREQ